MAKQARQSQSKKSSTKNVDLAAAAAKINTDDFGRRVRVHTIAKALGITSKEFIGVLEGFEITGKVPSSTLSKEEAIEIVSALEKKKKAVKLPQQDAVKEKAAPKKKSQPKQKSAPKQKAAQKKQADSKKKTDSKQADSKEEESQKTSAEEEKKGSQSRQTRRVRRVVRRVGSRALAESREDRQAEKKQAAKGKNHKPEKHEKPQDDVDADQLHPGERDDEDIVDEPVRLKGSTRLESKRRWRAENRDRGRKVVSRSEFLARRESVKRSMIVRDSQRSDHPGLTTQVGVVEDGQLVEHFIAGDAQHTTVGNIYLGRVQNVLASMEAAFIDIGTGRNAVLYASEMNWHSPHLHSKHRRIDQALRSGDQILVQVMKDPIGHKGARLTNRISFAGRYLVYFPGGTTAGISRRLPEAERKRLKEILKRVVPGQGGAIIRTAAENVEEKLIADDVNRLHRQWQQIEKDEERERSKKGAKPATLYEEPNMLIKVVRDLFNEDFSELIVDGDKSWQIVRDYMGKMAPELMDRSEKWYPEQHAGEDVFQAHGLDDQLTKALSRKVWLPSGGYLIFDDTEAMTVIDVNTGSFVGSGGNLEETVTENNLEAAEEIVRQLRLRDIGGMIVVDFIDMVLEENQDLVLRRLTEYLGRDRTHHKVGEVTSLGLVQITRKRLGAGLLETYSTECEACHGRGVIIHADPVEHDDDHDEQRHRNRGRGRGRDKRDNDNRRQQSQNKADDTAKKDDKNKKEEKKPNRGQQNKSNNRNNDSRSNDKRNNHGNKNSNKTQNKAENKQDTNADDKNDNRRSSRRRRRVVRSSTRNVAADAVRKAREADPEEPSSEDNADMQSGNRSKNNSRRRGRRGRRVVGKLGSGSADNRSYEEAKKEFDESPRRRRETRGHSKSDVPPKKQDFHNKGSGRNRRRRRVVRSKK